MIVGSGDPIKIFLKSVYKVYPKSKVLVLSDKKCDEAWSIYEKDPIDDIVKNLGFDIQLINDINTISVFNEILEHECNLCFVLGSRWILKERLIDHFKGCIFNYHTSSLPKYRGGGGYRWQVLNNEDSIYIAFHQLIDRIDAGPILKEYRKTITEILYPADIFKSLHQFTKEKFEVFLNDLDSDLHKLRIQNEADSTYFPLLDNDINGAININWSINDILSFIRAFSYPYKGAFLFYKNKRYFFKEAEKKNSKEKFHPYTIGLILNSSHDFVDFCVKDGVIRGRIIENENSDPVQCSFFTSGNRFYMTEKTLVEAKLYRPSNKNFLLTINNDANE